MIENTLEEPDTSQLEQDGLFERVEKLCDEWMQSRNRVPVKLVRDDKPANHRE